MPVAGFLDADPADNLRSVCKILANDAPVPKLSTVLRNARHHAGMTQRQLAELSGISVRAIRDLELEHTRAPRIQTVRLLADALRLMGTRRAELEAAVRQRPGTPLVEHLAAPPAPLGPVIGRAVESAALVTALTGSSGHRLVHVAGIPGVGKTRLIQEVVTDLHRHRRIPGICLNGTHFAHSGSLLERVATVIGRAADREEVTAAIAANDLVLTVDARDLDQNDERELRLLLSRCPGLRVLYETTGAGSDPGDPVLPIGPLALYGRGDRTAAGPAVEFLRSRCPRMAALNTDDPATTVALQDICRHLDGIPAALAAVSSWLEIHEPSVLLTIFSACPSVLTDMLGSVPAGPGSSLIGWLRRTIAALPDSEAVTLRRLADAGPWTVDQVLGLLHDPRDGTVQALHTLWARGLVRRTEAPEPDRGRFVVLNVVRHVLVADAAGLGTPGPREASPGTSR
ncbi:helix-turn-helix domain-containing protein [Streptomyces sp. NPDC051014]|uniref:helix-turn-helix domain-containing protein n=1 Tax=Streptomyces sp. NPDC051014 TaxID=3155751 RepID=UPI0033EE0729